MCRICGKNSKKWRTSKSDDASSALLELRTAVPKHWGMFSPNCLINLRLLEMFPLKHKATGRRQTHARCSLDRACKFLPHCPSRLSPPIWILGLAVETSVGINAHSAFVVPLLRIAASNMMGSLKIGADSRHGNFIFSPTNRIAPQPQHTSIRKQLAEVQKTEKRWQLSLQSWRDKVISFHVATGEHRGEGTSLF